MTVKKSIKFTLAFVTIFVLGALTGAALMPVIFNKVEGNPYSINVLSERIYNTNLLKNAGLTPDQEAAVDELSAEYVLKYTAERDMFMAKRRTLYGEFKFDLNKILTTSQYDNFVNKSDALIKERELYSKALEDKWRAERAKKTDEKLQSAGFEQKLKYITLSVPAQDIIPQNLNAAANQDKANFDFLNRYMIDRVKYKWGTYTVYHEVTNEKDILKSEDIIP